MRPRGPEAGWRVLVTGASSGLGRALALELARRGCSLVLTGRNQGRLEEVAAEAQRAGAPWTATVVADLSVDGGAQGLVDRLDHEGWPVDALVNNAGAGWSGAWSGADLGTDRRLVTLLVEAPLVLTRGLWDGWHSRGRGAILNVASTGAFQPGPQTAVYYAAKAFLMNWSVALAREERSWLAVTTLCPGALKTGFARAAEKNDVPGAPGPEATARIAVNAWAQGRGLVVPGLQNQWAVWLSRLVGPTWSARAVETVQLAVKKR